jgi:hypothetical protein
VKNQFALSKAINIRKVKFSTHILGAM